MKPTGKPSLKLHRVTLRKLSRLDAGRARGGDTLSCGCASHDPDDPTTNGQPSEPGHPCTPPVSANPC
ncbi:MAG: hypothetical protein KC591_08355 [Gemmatimonadetes bacterium]|nr:hypothetical protein [Gemmatimonadota bacterium]